MRGIIIILQLVTVKATKTLLRLLETNNNKTEQKEKIICWEIYLHFNRGKKKKKEISIDKKRK